MYRAYPDPSQPLPGSNGNGNGNGSAHAHGSNKNLYVSSTANATTGVTNTNGGAPPVAMPGSVGIGARPNFGNPTLPPPPKKHRAIPLPMTTHYHKPGSSSTTGASGAAATGYGAPPTKSVSSMPPSLVDDKIAQRRAQLRSLKAQKANSNAPSILARARAVTTASNNNSAGVNNTNSTNISGVGVGVGTGITGSYLNHDVQNYAIRSRPIAVPKSPVGMRGPGITSPIKTRVPPPVPAASSSAIAAPKQPPIIGDLPPSKVAPYNNLTKTDSQAINGEDANHIVPPVVQRTPLMNPALATGGPPPVNNGDAVAKQASASVPGPVDTPATAKLVGQLLQQTKNGNGSANTNSNTSRDIPLTSAPPVPMGQPQSVQVKPLTDSTFANTNTGATPTAPKKGGEKEKMDVATNNAGDGNRGNVDLPPSNANKPPIEKDPEVTGTNVNANASTATISSTATGGTSISSKRLTLAALRNAAKSPTKEISGNLNGTSGENSMVNGNDKTQNMTKNGGHKEEDEEGSTEGHNETSTLRLVKELRKAKDEKAEAMKRMAKLESEVMQLRLDSTKALQIQNVHQDHEEEHRRRGVGRGSPRRRRMKSPEPSSRSRPDANPLRDMNIASRAVETVEDVFTSNLATYVVRKPYGGNETMDYTFPEDSDDEQDANEEGPTCSISWHESIESYVKNSNVQDDKTLEVLARLEADGSILLIYGDSCRHGVPTIGDGGITGYEFKTFENVEYLEGSLGKIVFIDAEGNDGEYWLDPVYEEALKIRETYCSNVFSAALALKASSPESASSPLEYSNGFAQSQPAFVPSVARNPLSGESSVSNKLPVERVDACVGTEDLPQPKTVPVEKPKSRSINFNLDSTMPQEKPKPSAAKPQKKEPVQNMQEGDFGSTDVLSSFILYFFSTIFSIIWFFIMIPVRVTRFALTTMLIMFIVQMIWMYMIDIRTAMEMGALIDKQYNIN